jgi:hypothetical protein
LLALSGFRGHAAFSFYDYFRSMRQSGIPVAGGDKYFKILLLAVYLVVWGLLLPDYRYRLYADTISYLDIARHYLRGDWYQALNGYWAPLISWLLAPFLKAGWDPLLSFKILAMGSGILALSGADRLMQTLQVMPLIRRVVLVALVPLLAWFALQVSTPDLLSAGILLFYLAESYRLIFPQDPASAGFLKQSLVVGLLAAAAYLGKNYNFYFVLVHLPGLFLYSFMRKDLRQSWKSMLHRVSLAGLVFILIAGCWVLPLSYKYGRFTTGTAGTFNVNLAGPHAKGFPYTYQGLIPPPHAQATHSWEDPSRYQLPAWHPWASPADLAYEVSLTRQNAVKYLAMVWHYHPLVLVFLLIALWLFVQLKQDDKRNLGFGLFAILLYPLGYWLIYLEERHVWICIILLYILTAQVLSIMLRQAHAWQRWLLLGTLLFTLVNQPLRDLYDHRTVNQRHFYMQAKALQPLLPLAGRNLATQDGDWHQGLFLSFFTRSRYYGEVPEGITDKSLYQTLQQHRIDYYLVWGKPKNNLSRLQKVVYLPAHHLTVYRVK